MIKMNEYNLSKRPGMIRRKERWISGRKDLNHHFSGTYPKHIRKGSQHKVNIK
jgi:hypothetical protein